VGVQMTNATVASIVNLTLPVFAAVLALLLGMEAFNWTTAAGALVAWGRGQRRERRAHPRVVGESECVREGASQ